MARTPSRSWAGCPGFGLRDLFEHGRSRTDLPGQATEAINTALQDLGLLKYIVGSIVDESPSGTEIASYSVKLIFADGRGPAVSLKL